MDYSELEPNDILAGVGDLGTEPLSDEPVVIEEDEEEEDEEEFEFDDFESLNEEAEDLDVEID